LVSRRGWVDSGANGEVRVKVFMRGSVQRCTQGALRRLALLAEKKPLGRALRENNPQHRPYEA
jgi:hypothetical protein